MAGAGRTMSIQRPRDQAEEDDYDDIPLHHKRPFGAGIKRKRVEFVPAQHPDENAVGTIHNANAGSAIGDIYASIVLKQPKPRDTVAVAPTSNALPTHRDDIVDNPSSYPICPTCSLPITTTPAEHVALLAHQVSLDHSHPPSHLDRQRMGLRALELKGWNPDARRGLGREGEGLRYPIKVSAKDDTLGIGATVPEVKPREPKKKPLGVKELRLEREKERRKAQRLQGEIYGRVDVEAYLRGDGRYA